MRRFVILHLGIGSVVILSCVALTTGCRGTNTFGDINCPSGSGYNSFTGMCQPNVEPPMVIILSLKVGAVAEPPYGNVLGFYQEGYGVPATLTAGGTVQFVAADATAPHTAAYLGAATSTAAPWPATCSASLACTSTSASPANTVISTPGFTTGTLATSQTSLVYVVPSPGFWMFGCHYHYDSMQMRTVIISE